MFLYFELSWCLIKLKTYYRAISSFYLKCLSGRSVFEARAFKQFDKESKSEFGSSRSAGLSLCSNFLQEYLEICMFCDPVAATDKKNLTRKGVETIDKNARNSVYKYIEHLQGVLSIKTSTVPKSSLQAKLWPALLNCTHEQPN